jgi:ubiquitin-protein ligase
MENNNLVPVWNELPEIKKLLRIKNPKEETKNDQIFDEIKLFEKAGKLKIIMREAKFFLELDVNVPEDYPARKPEIKFVDHNYD